MHKLIFIILFSIASNAFCQENSIKSYYGYVGSGFSVAPFNGSKLGCLYGGGVTISSKHSSYSLIYNNNIEFDIFGDLPEEIVYSIDLLYGINYNNKHRGLIFPFFPFGLLVKREFESMLTINIGIGYVGTRKRTSLKQEGSLGDYYNTKYPSTIGLALSLNLIEKTTSFLGFGVCGYANLNKETSYMGIRGDIYFGNFDKYF